MAIFAFHVPFPAIVLGAALADVPPDRIAGAFLITDGRVHDVPADAAEERVRELALADEAVQRHIAGKAVKKAIVVPGKLINIVVAG